MTDSHADLPVCEKRKAILSGGDTTRGGAPVLIDLPYITPTLTQDEESSATGERVQITYRYAGVQDGVAYYVREEQ